jgi:hypothetical protein
VGQPHGIRLGGRDAGRRAAPARGGGRSARRALPLRQGRALDDGRDRQTAVEARHRVFAPLGDTLWNGSTSPRAARRCRAGGARPAADAAAARRSLTFWEILASRGHEAAVLGWPASLPAREGLVLWASDVFFDGDAGGNSALPAEAAARARLFRVSPDGLDRPLARALVPDGLAAGAARRAPLRGAARDLTVTGAALAALPGGPRNVSAVVLSGLAEVSGLFGSAGDARYWGLAVPEAEARAAALRAYYRFLDDLLGEILEREGRDRTICLFAPVGWGPPPTLEAVSRFLRGRTPAASPDAARDGFVLLSGAGVRSGVRLTSASVLDLAPTLLVLAGEPVARDMDGRVLAEAFDERFTESASVPIVSTFEPAGPQ